MTAIEKLIQRLIDWKMVKISKVDDLIREAVAELREHVQEVEDLKAELVVSRELEKDAVRLEWIANNSATVHKEGIWRKSKKPYYYVVYRKGGAASGAHEDFRKSIDVAIKEWERK